jgi:L-alanine-DL-glutamate epimerase-like enolase superfamily enzyme
MTTTKDHAVRRLDVPVEQVAASAYTIPTERPESDGTMTWDATTWVVVRVSTGDPSLPVGVGWTYAPAPAVAIVEDLLSDVVVGTSALDVGRAWGDMARAVRNAGRPGLVSMALSAVDTALWDLKARLLDLPLHRLLGAVRDEVWVYGSGGFTSLTDDELVSQLSGWREQGMERMKIKIGEAWGTDVERDLARTSLARATIGAEAELYVDANGGYTIGQAVRVARELEQHDVVWFEEPVSSDDHAGLRRVRDSTTVDVAAGEYGDRLAYFALLLSDQTVDCLQIDVTRCGGYSEWLRVAALAAAYGLEVSGHCAPALHVPVAAATPNLRHLEWFADHVRIEERFLEGFVGALGGNVVPAETPGHGLALREPDLESYRVA